MTTTDDALATSAPSETDGTEDTEVGIVDDDDLDDATDGEAVVVPGQRPGPTETPG